MKNYPKIYNNDIKVLGRVVSIATENKVAAAEQVFDEKFKYIDLPRYSQDNIDTTTEGLDQYTINRLFGKKFRALDEAGIMPDAEGWLHNVKIDGLTVKGDTSFDNLNIVNNLNVGDKITTKDLEVTNRADIKSLFVNGQSFADILNRLNTLENWKAGDFTTWKNGIDSWKSTISTWKTTVDSDLSWLRDNVNYLLQCCIDMQNRPQGGIMLYVNPESIDFTVGDPDIALSARTEPQLVGSATFTSNDASVCTIVNSKAHAVAEEEKEIKEEKAAEAAKEEKKEAPAKKPAAKKAPAKKPAEKKEEGAK